MKIAEKWGFGMAPPKAGVQRARIEAVVTVGRLIAALPIAISLSRLMNAVVGAVPCHQDCVRAKFERRLTDSEEKHEPASDIDTAVADSLKTLDPDGPIREADSCIAAISSIRSLRQHHEGTLLQLR